jgi:hypothetical protein
MKPGQIIALCSGRPSGNSRCTVQNVSTHEKAAVPVVRLLQGLFRGLKQNLLGALGSGSQCLEQNSLHVIFDNRNSQNNQQFLLFFVDLSP